MTAVGRNYRDHAAEFSASGFDASETSMLPEHPVIFTKAATSVIGPDEPIVLANDPTGTTDHEGELGVVIGEPCRHATRATALDHVFGWTVVNDVTARVLQKRHVQRFVGKSLDTFCQLGPCITTIDELPDISQTWIRTHVDGELRQEMPASALPFDVASLVVTLSDVMTLMPDDVIATGTGRRVGISFDPPSISSVGTSWRSRSTGSVPTEPGAPMASDLPEGTRPSDWAAAWRRGRAHVPGVRTIDVHTHLMIPESAELVAPHFRPEGDPRTLSHLGPQSNQRDFRGVDGS